MSTQTSSNILEYEKHMRCTRPQIRLRKNFFTKHFQDFKDKHHHPLQDRELDTFTEIQFLVQNIRI